MQRGAGVSDLLPVFVGFVTWVLCLSILTEPLRAVAPSAAAADGPTPSRPTPRPTAGAAS